jgi:hypothetical protein
MEMTCPYSVAKMLSEVLATHNAACAEKINNFVSKIASSTALKTKLEETASEISSEQMDAINALAKLFGQFANFASTALIETAKKINAYESKQEIQSAADEIASAEKMKADYDAKCEAFPKIEEEVNAFNQYLSDMHSATQNKAALLQAMTGEAVAAFNSLEAPAVVVVDAPVVAETPEVVVDVPVVTEAPIEVAVVDAPVVVETPEVVVDVPVVTEAPIEVAVVDAPVVVETPEFVVDAPVVTEVPVEVAVVDAPVVVETPEVVVDVPVVTEAPIEVAVVDAPVVAETPEVVVDAPVVTEAPVEVAVVDAPVVVETPEVVVDAPVVIEAPVEVAVVDAPVVVDVPAAPVEEMPVVIEEPAAVVVETPVAEVVDGDFLSGDAPTLVDATLEA